jgi:UDP-glucose 4-epimerase
MKCLVTGGAGFIGSHICEALIRNGHEVISVDNYSAGKPQNIAHLKASPLFREEMADVTDYWEMNYLVKGVDFIFHQAASKKNICDIDPGKDLHVNAGGTLTMLQLAVKHNVGKFIHASTGSVYGEAVQLQDEEHPLKPASYYGVSKLAGENYVRLFMDKLPCTILRYFHVYGARQEDGRYGGVVAIFDRALREGKPIKIYGDGLQQRSFTHVDDVVWANLTAMTTGDGQIYNCASGIKVIVNELLYKMIELHDKENHPVEYHDWLPGDVKVFDIDNSKIVADFNMDFETDLMSGLKKTIWGSYN